MTAAENAKVGEGNGLWQPIETAPKDTSEIFLWYPHIASMERARWSPHYGGAWLVWHRGVAWTKRYAPTHWMPLPPPPTATITKRGGRDERT